MKALLVRVGIDATAGRWNAPVEVASGRYVYVPIPESHRPRPGLGRPYTEIKAALNAQGVSLPAHLQRGRMHLDPDFEHLTYGDQGRRAHLKGDP